MGTTSKKNERSLIIIREFFKKRSRMMVRGDGILFSMLLFSFPSKEKSKKVSPYFFPSYLCPELALFVLEYELCDLKGVF